MTATRLAGPRWSGMATALPIAGEDVLGDCEPEMTSAIGRTSGHTALDRDGMTGTSPMSGRTVIRGVPVRASRFRRHSPPAAGGSGT